MQFGVCGRSEKAERTTEGTSKANLCNQADYNEKKIEPEALKVAGKSLVL